MNLKGIMLCKRIQYPKVVFVYESVYTTFMKRQSYSDGQQLSGC